MFFGLGLLPMSNGKLRVPRFSVVFGIFFAILLSIAGQVAEAQTQQKVAPSQQTPESTEEREELLKPSAIGRKVPLAYDEIQALEGVIVDSEYVVGPGDVFSITIYGGGVFNQEFIVTPEGKLVIPSVGILDVAGRTLTEAKSLLRRLSSQKYRLAKVTMSLVRLRPIRVHVLGEVQKADTYVATPVDRVSRLIQMAEGFTPWSDKGHIEIRHRDGTVDTLDYLKCLNEASLDQDIFVQDGDVIYVPPIRFSGPLVKVEGLSVLAGYYKLRPGETVWSFLRRFTAYFRMFKLDDVAVLRKNSGEQKMYHVDLLPNGEDPETLTANSELMPGDVVIIPMLRRYVYVSGAVQAPGNQPFMEGFTVLDYVGMAGGTRESANIGAAKVFHVRTGKWAKGPREPVERGDFIVVPETARRKWMDYLSITSGIASIILAAKAIGVI